jgi:hypothetical protein
MDDGQRCYRPQFVKLNQHCNDHTRKSTMSVNERAVIGENIGYFTKLLTNFIFFITQQSKSKSVF